MISLIKDTNINMIWMSFVVIFWLQQTPSWCLRLTPTKRMTSHCCKTYLAMREKHHNYDPIVVTGLGIISPAGHDVYSYFHSIVEGQSTIGKVTKFDAVKFRCQIAAQVKGFHAADYYKSNKKEPNNLSSHYAVAAARQAISDAKLNLPEGSGCEASRVGVVIGSAFGGIIAMQDAAHALQFRGNLAVDKFTIPNMLGSTVASVVAKEFGVTGPSFVLESACASGTHAIGQAMRLLQNDDADIIIAGGTDAAITPLTFAGFCNLELMSTQNNAKPLSASRPFDSNRDGFVMGEGSGMLILEKFSYAIKRNARVYCELVGFGSSSDAHQNLLVPQPEGQGLQRAMKSCFRDANILPEEVIICK